MSERYFGFFFGARPEWWKDRVKKRLAEPDLQTVKLVEGKNPAGSVDAGCFQIVDEELSEFHAGLTKLAVLRTLEKMDLWKAGLGDGEPDSDTWLPTD